MRVLVISYNNIGNFGDRLGYHLINSVLPPQAEVYFANFEPWNVPSYSFDLLILGIGNSIFAPLMNQKLFKLLTSNKIKFKIGIFGTQYRKEIRKDLMRSLISYLDLWLARYKEDLELYGYDLDNSIHFGDWLIDAFPITVATLPGILEIKDEIWQNLPLDRTIQNIQRYQKVFSTRLHPLLCALTSAKFVAYREQRESGTGEISGKFRSMFLDIFEKDFPENQFFPVDKEKVISYKSFVRNNIEKLRKLLKELCLNQIFPSKTKEWWFSN